MSYPKLKLQAGQAISGVIIATAILTSAGNWIVNRVLTSPDNLSMKVTQVEKDIVALKTSDGDRERRLTKIEGDVEYIRRVVEEMGRRQGIIINTKNVSQ